MSKVNGFAVAVAIFLAGVPLSLSAQSESEVNRIIRGLAPISGQTISENETESSDFGAFVGVQELNVLEVVVGREVILINLRYALDFSVYFEFGAADFVQSAYSELDILGAALSSSELSTYNYLVMGHTDAVGSAEFNRSLSELRADAVRQYLIENFLVSPERLVSVGFGEERLKFPGEPSAALNRRVELAMIANR